MISVLSAVLFVHVLSAIALFAALALEATILVRVRSSRNIEQARASVHAFQRRREIAIPAFLGVLGGGLYLASRYGSGTIWIPLSLAATLLIMLIGGLITGRRMGRLRKLVSSVDDAVPFERVSAQVTDKALVLSYGFRMGLAVGIVFLMTTQPELGLSLAALGIASVAGVVLATAFIRGFTMQGIA
jgi:hypothetical protein